MTWEYRKILGQKKFVFLLVAILIKYKQLLVPGDFLPGFSWTNQEV
jgi:hypothetical protein